jgi:hypothetical protein
MFGYLLLYYPENVKAVFNMIPGSEHYCKSHETKIVTVPQAHSNESYLMPYCAARLIRFPCFV